MHSPSQKVVSQSDSPELRTECPIVAHGDRCWQYRERRVQCRIGMSCYTPAVAAHRPAAHSGRADDAVTAFHTPHDSHVPVAPAVHINVPSWNKKEPDPMFAL